MKRVWLLVALGAVVVVVFALYFAAVVYWWVPADGGTEDSVAARRGQFGDMFGALTALFSGLALAAVALELRDSANASRAQADGYRAQVESNELTREAMRAERANLERQQAANAHAERERLARAALAAFRDRVKQTAGELYKSLDDVLKENDEKAKPKLAPEHARRQQARAALQRLYFEAERGDFDGLESKGYVDLRQQIVARMMEYAPMSSKLIELLGNFMDPRSAG